MSVIGGNPLEAGPLERGSTVFHFIGKLWLSIDWMSLQTKLIGQVNLIILFHLAPSRMLYNKYFSRYDFLKDLFMKIANWIFFDFLWFWVESKKECIYVCLSMQIQQNMFMSIAAYLWGEF